MKQSSLYLATLLALSLSACDSWDEGASFPEDYESTYLKIHDCAESNAHNAANYAITWLSPEGEASWAAMMEGITAGAEPAPLPTGTVLVKAQYEDEACSELSGYTAMEQLAPGTNPELGDFRWQFLGADGSCNDCDSGTNCSGCHTAPNCGTAFPYVCTTME